jgi:hypothetical protein
LIRTYLVFKDLPVHVEYRVSDMPIVPEGVCIRFKVNLKHPRDLNRIRKVDGNYKVSKRLLVYSFENQCNKGLTQYLELDLVNG